MLAKFKQIHLTMGNSDSLIQLSLPFIFILSFFALPLTNGVRSILFPLPAIAILLIPSYKEDFFAFIKKKYVYAFAGFFVWILIASLWSSANSYEKFYALVKYSKFLLIPFFAVGLQNPVARYWGLRILIFSALIPCCLSILNSFGIYKYHEIMDPGQVFTSHIATGFLMAFVGYLSFYLACKQRGWERLGFMSLGILFGYQVLFINTGRTGYIVYFILMLILFMQAFSWKKACLLTVFFSAFFALAYLNSPVMKNGFTALVSDVNSYERNKDTSLGYRIQLHAYGKSLFLKHPIIGNGTGDYSNQFSIDKPTSSYEENVLFAHPHSQYWLILVDQGIVGMLFFLVFMGSLLYMAIKAREFGPMLFAFLVIFCLCNFSDAMFIGDAPIPHLLILFSALCWGELLERQC